MFDLRHKRLYSSSYVATATNAALYEAGICHKASGGGQRTGGGAPGGGVQDGGWRAVMRAGGGRAVLSELGNVAGGGMRAGVRSGERRGGEEGVRECRSRGSAEH